MEIMLDVKKLITGFLILTLGASTAAWILSGTNNQPRAVSEAENPAVTQPLNNAFINTTSTVPQDVANLLAGALPPATEAALNDSNNLTAAMGNSLLDGLVSANPDGIPTDASGNGQINQPDAGAILAEISQSPSIQNLRAPNWEADVADNLAKIKISSASSRQSMVDYLNAFVSINNKYFVQSGLQQIADEASTTDPSSLTVDPSVMASAEVSVTHALADTTQLAVPAPFVPFQKAWIRLLTYEKNTADLFNTTPTDPARTAVALSLEKNNYNGALADLSTTFQKTLREEKISIKTNESGQGSITAFIGDLFFVKTADAAVGVSVPVYDPLVEAAIHGNTASIHAVGWGTFFKNLALDMVLQILKNTLMAQLQNHVLKWIQNSGAPRFVQNWMDDFANAGIMAATNAIDKNFECVSSVVFPQIQIIMNAIYKPGNSACAAQFSSLLSGHDLQNFYDNFANGGFVTFGQTLLPSNDFYGGLFFTAQVAGQAAYQSQNVLGVKMTAQQGFKGTEVCPQGDGDPNGFHLTCPDGAPPNTTYSCPGGYTLNNSDNICNSPTGDIAAIPNDTCSGGLLPTNEANNGFCNDGASPKTTTPGQLTGMMLNQSLGTAPKLIAGATTIDGLINAFTISLIESIASQLVTSVSGAINNSINNLSSGGLTGINPGSIVASTSTASALSCSPLTTIASPGDLVEFTAGGGTYDTVNGNLPDYAWSSSDGQTGTGPVFDVTYAATGTYSVALGDLQGDAPAVCVAQIGGGEGSQSSGVACSPATQTVTFGTSHTVTLTATGGAITTSGGNPTYTWSAPGSTAASGGLHPGDSFQVTYNATGTYNISVVASTDNSSSTCTVILQ